MGAKNFAAQLTYHQGAYEEGLDLIEEATKIEFKRGWKSRLANFYVDKAHIYLDLGKIEEAEEIAHQVLKITEELEFSFDLWSIDFAYFALARAAKLKGEFNTARNNLNSALKALENRKHLGGIYFEEAIGYTCRLGQLAIAEGDINSAIEYRKEVIDIIEQANKTQLPFNGHRFESLEADIALHQNNTIQARKHIKNAFEIISKNERQPALLYLFTQYAAVLTHEGDTLQATAFLHCAAGHSASDYETKQIAEKALGALELELSDVLDFDELLQLLHNNG